MGKVIWAIKEFQKKYAKHSSTNDLFNILREKNRKLEQVNEISTSYTNRLEQLISSHYSNSSSFDQTILGNILRDNQIFDCGLPHLRRMLQMQSSAEKALKSIVDLESEGLTNLITLSEDSINYFKYNPDKKVNTVIAEIDDQIHTYFIKLSTLVDNLYYTTAAYYNLNSTKTKEERINFQEQLRTINPKLRTHLKNKLAFGKGYEFNLLRNAETHHLPIFNIEFEKKAEDITNYSFLLNIKYPDESIKNEKLFNKLFEHYNYVVNVTYQALEIMLSKSRPHIN